MITHGATLTLLRQKADWMPGRAGVFDRGVRRWKCLAADANGYMATDLQLGARDPVERLMFIDSRVMEREEGNTAIIRVDLVGILGGATGTTRRKVRRGSSLKKSATIFSTGSEFISVAPTNTESITFTGKTQAYLPVPSAVHRWVSLGVRPPVAATGIAAEPPGLSARDVREVAGYFDTLSDAGGLVVFEGWVRQKRDIVTPGDVMPAPVYQVEDFYEYIQMRAQGTEA